jgi:hypothetical protein
VAGLLGAAPLQALAVGDAVTEITVNAPGAPAVGKTEVVVVAYDGKSSAGKDFEVI